jgi:hypothetical protein
VSTVNGCEVCLVIFAGCQARIAAHTHGPDLRDARHVRRWLSSSCMCGCARFRASPCAVASRLGLLWGRLRRDGVYGFISSIPQQSAPLPSGPPSTATGATRRGDRYVGACARALPCRENARPERGGPKTPHIEALGHTHTPQPDLSKRPKSRRLQPGSAFPRRAPQASSATAAQPQRHLEHVGHVVGQRHHQPVVLWPQHDLAGEARRLAEEIGRDLIVVDRLV